MSLEADQLVDRRRLKRNLNIWRALAVIAVFGAVAVATVQLDVIGDEAHIARLNVKGVIMDNAKRDRALDALVDDTQAKAVIVTINSPGGTVVGGEVLYRKLGRIAAKKPVVAVMGSTATSAAYMASLAADRIFAHEGTVTGSIGVLMQTADMTEMLQHWGIRPETIKSVPLKAQPNPLEPFSPEARSVTEGVIKDLHAFFVGLVAERRAMNEPVAMALADGRIFTGRQALAVGLVDALGGEEEALKWLEEQGVSEDLPVKDVKIKDLNTGMADLLGGALGGLLPQDLVALIGKALFSERLRLDGVLSLWHPEVH